MNQYTRKHKFLSFFLSEIFLDALRIAFSIVVPVVLAFICGFPHEAISIGLGALMISLTDSAGSVEQKRSMSLISLPLFFLLALVAGLTWSTPWLLGLVLVVVVFGGSMLSVFGSRYYLLGTAAIILTIFVMGFRPQAPLAFSLELLIGATWYYVVSLLHSKLFPFKSSKYAVVDCIFSTADYLMVKTLFYKQEVSLEQAHKSLLNAHLRVNEKQEQIRAIVLKEPRTMKDGNNKGKMLLRLSVNIIDIYEEITEVHYDYVYLRKALRASGVLELVCHMIEVMANELKRIGYALNARAKIHPFDHYLEELALMEERLQYIIERESPENASLLKKLQWNIGSLTRKIENTRALVNMQEMEWEQETDIQYEHFVKKVEKPWELLWRHFNTNSGVFRFAARLTIACLFGYILSLFHPLGNYSYWIVLTIVIIVRPTFQHTVNRNKQRLAGSLIGIGIGFGIICLITSTPVQLSIAILSLLAFFAINRINYQVSVIFVTVMVILCLNIYTGSESIIIVERLIDTLIGCGIAFAASYVFPVWESGKVSFFMEEVLKSNITYLERLKDEILGKKTPLTSYKLSRKDAYVSLANLAAAFNGMLVEPRKLSMQEKDIYQFQVLNQMLTSVVSSFFRVSKHSDPDSFSSIDCQEVDKAIDSLSLSVGMLQGDAVIVGEEHKEETALLQLCEQIKIHTRKAVNSTRE